MFEDEVSRWVRSSWEDWELPGDAEHIVPAMIFNPRGTRNTLMFYAPGRRSPLAAVKVAWGRGDRVSLRNEHVALRQIAERPALRHIAPAALGLLEADGVTAVASTGIAGRRLVLPKIAVGQRASKRVVRALHRYLTATDEVAATLARATPASEASRVRCPGGDLDEYASRAELTAKVRGRLRGWARELSSTGAATPLCLQHGDIFPGNVLTQHRHRQISLVDWECASDDHWPWFDSCYVILGLCLLASGDRPGAAMSTLFARGSWVGDVAQDVGGQTSRAISSGMAFLSTAAASALRPTRTGGALAPKWVQLVDVLAADEQLRDARPWLSPLSS
jgi:hypothetical protein